MKWHETHREGREIDEEEAGEREKNDTISARVCTSLSYMQSIERWNKLPLGMTCFVVFFSFFILALLSELKGSPLQRGCENKVTQKFTHGGIKEEEEEEKIQIVTINTGNRWNDVKYEIVCVCVCFCFVVKRKGLKYLFAYIFHLICDYTLMYCTYSACKRVTEMFTFRQVIIYKLSIHIHLFHLCTSCTYEWRFAFSEGRKLSEEKRESSQLFVCLFVLPLHLKPVDVCVNLYRMLTMTSSRKYDQMNYITNDYLQRMMRRKKRDSANETICWQ